ncbi:MAG: hypothetical protein K2O28_01985 [Clostridia bacterium]|nr:hypothetical protein [Clostridia bacterium]
MISLNKKQPKYLYKLNLALVLFFALWFALGVPLMVTIGCIYGEEVITYAVMISTFALFFIGFAIFFLVDNKLHKRFIEERAAQLEEEFCEMPFEDAEQILKEKGIITDAGFVVKTDGVFGECVIPFEKAHLAFNFIELASTVNMDLWVFAQDGEVPEIDYNITSVMEICKQNESWKNFISGSSKHAVYKLNCAIYNYLRYKDTNIKYDQYFKLLVKDKKEFTKEALKYSKMLTWNFTGYRIRF